MSRKDKSSDRIHPWEVHRTNKPTSVLREGEGHDDGEGALATYQVDRSPCGRVRFRPVTFHTLTSSQSCTTEGPPGTAAAECSERFAGAPGGLRRASALRYPLLAGSGHTQQLKGYARMILRIGFYLALPVFNVSFARAFLLGRRLDVVLMSLGFLARALCSPPCSHRGAVFF